MEQESDFQIWIDIFLVYLNSKIPDSKCKLFVGSIRLHLLPFSDVPLTRLFHLIRCVALVGYNVILEIPKPTGLTP